MVKEIRITVSDEDFAEMSDAKGNRSWRQAIKEELLA